MKTNLPMTAPTPVSKAQRKLYHGAKNSTYDVRESSQRKYESRFSGTDYFVEIGGSQVNHIACGSNTIENGQYASDKGERIHKRTHLQSNSSELCCVY